MIRIATSQGAAWRGVYAYCGQTQIVRLGVDPNGGTRPELFGALGRWSFRLRLPLIAWRYPCGPLRMRLYQAQGAFWAGMDGRYGWCTEYRRRARGVAP